MYHQHKKAHTSRKTRTETSLVRIVHVSSAYVTVLCYCAEQYCNSSLGTHTHKCTQRSQQLWSQLYTTLQVLRKTCRQVQNTSPLPATCGFTCAISSNVRQIFYLYINYLAPQFLRHRLHQLGLSLRYKKV